ncbi:MULTISPECIES: PIN-like domain-containing protein [Bacillus cereus group]|uniref:PIN-like domain-containing protein n=1 Tax=Bacillus cereus group TaxID=86661 RepID=UPI0005CA4D2D|nr:MULTISPECIES: PIN-like domain-containing protein [Bacillus cereus group]PGZ37551.1 hypothetical protein COE52_21715 [Bacillus thuringiensis]
MENSYFNLFIKVKNIEEIKETATIVIDTNVLLMGYQWKDMTFESVLKVLKRLSEEDRLKIPSHVIKEFAKLRPAKIEEMSRQIQDVLSNFGPKVKNGKPLYEVIPALSILKKYHSDIIDLEDKYNKCIEELNNAKKAYTNGLQRLQQTLGTYIDDDVILNNYKEIIENSYFSPKTLMDEKELKENWKYRVDNKIPPGYMDKSKKVNQYGDLIVWDHICQIKNDVIFVTADVKGDWVYNVNDDIMGARRELVEEFYERELSKGHTFKVLNPLQFINLFSDGDVEQEIKDDLNKEIKHPIATGSVNLYNLNKEEAINKIIQLRNNPIIRKSTLNEGFDDIENELDDFLITTNNFAYYISLMEEYRKTLELLIENPSSEFLRSIDIKSLIDTIRDLKQDLK